jgi:predicted HAD superfamily Cof-like phosphohydrolase
MKKLIEDVTEFHKAYDRPVGTVKFSDEAMMLLRERLVNEEATEFSDSMFDYDAEGALDGICDLIYVAVGVAVTYGWNLEEAWRRVHESNMSKLGEDGQPIVRPDGKILKGPNFKPPVLGDLVADNNGQ